MPSFQVSKLGCDSHRMHTRGGRWVACQQAAGRCSSHPTCPHPSPTCPSLPALTGPSTFLLTHRTILQPIPHPCFLYPSFHASFHPSSFFTYIHSSITHPCVHSSFYLSTICPSTYAVIHTSSALYFVHPHDSQPLLKPWLPCPSFGIAVP